MPPRPSPAEASSIALWPLALLAALLPICATVGAAWWSMRAGLVPSCNPFFEGCVSISRAARLEPAIHWFRALMLPAATLQGLVWVIAARWLRTLPIERARGERWLVLLGVTAAVALVLYVTFLGTEGSIYRALRRWGTAAYFGFTCICLLLTGGAIRRAAAAGVLRLAPALARSVLGFGAALVTLGIVNTLVAAALAEPWKDKVENASEWWGGAIFVLGFVALALMWRRVGLVLEFGVTAGATSAIRSPRPPRSPPP